MLPLLLLHHPLLLNREVHISKLTLLLPLLIPALPHLLDPLQLAFPLRARLFNLLNLLLDSALSVADHKLQLVQVLLIPRLQFLPLLSLLVQPLTVNWGVRVGIVEEKLLLLF